MNDTFMLARIALTVIQTSRQIYGAEGTLSPCALSDIACISLLNRTGILYRF